MESFSVLYLHEFALYARLQLGPPLIATNRSVRPSDTFLLHPFNVAHNLKVSSNIKLIGRSIAAIADASRCFSRRKTDSSV